MGIGRVIEVCTLTRVRSSSQSIEVFVKTSLPAMNTDKQSGLPLPALQFNDG